MNKRDMRLKKVAMQLLAQVPIDRQHAIIATISMIIEQQDLEGKLTLGEGCSIYNDSDLELYMMHEGYDYPDAYRIKAYVQSIVELR